MIRFLSMLREGLGIGWDALMANKLRAGLTVLGVTIGVSVVVTMAALITGIRTEVSSAFTSAGPDNLILTPWDFTDVQLVNDGTGRPPWWDRPNITENEVRKIQELPSVYEAVISFNFEARVAYQGKDLSIGAAARGQGWPAYDDGEFLYGRNFTPEEERRRDPVVVLFEDVARELFGDRDPVGQRVRVSTGRRASEYFTVVGVYRVSDNIFADAAENVALFPWTTSAKRLQGLGRFNFLTVFVVPVDGVGQQRLRDDIIGTLRGLRGLRPAEENNFALIQSTQLLDLFDRLTGVFFLVMLALSSVALLVGGIGVIGIMMISVTERTREIGVRKALGATRTEILWQFLVEAGILTFIGGAVGLASGAGLAEIVQNITPIPARIPLWSVFAALSMALVTGMVFGLIPAIRASRLDPVDALRYE